MDNPNALMIVRVSGASQVNNTSPETQQEMAQQLATTKKLHVVEVLSEMAVSGKLYESRELLQQAIARVESGEIGHLIFGQFDRSGRDVVNSELMYRRVYAAGGQIHHADFTFENTPEGKMLRQHVMSIKEYERESIATRTKRGRRNTADHGKMPTRFHAPYGYYLVKKVDILAGRYPAEREGRYEVMPDEAVVARRIYEMFVVERMSYNSICTKLNMEFVPSPQEGVRKSAKVRLADGGRTRWQAETIKNILKNSAYRGVPIWHKTDRVWDESRKAQRGLKTVWYNVPSDQQVRLSCEALVDDTMWNAAQRLSAEVSTRFANMKGHKYKTNSLLAGIFKCAECGSGMNRFGKAGNGGVRSFYYRCPYGAGNRPNGSHTCGNGRIYRMETIDSEVLEIIMAIADRPERVARAVKVYESEMMASGGSDARRAALQDEIQDIGKREMAIARKQIEMEIAGNDTSVYDDLLKEMNLRREAVRSDLSELPPDSQVLATVSHERLVQFSQIVADLRGFLSDPEEPASLKQKAIAQIVDRVVVGEDRKPTVWFRSFSAVPGVRDRGVPVAMHDLLRLTTGTPRITGRVERGEITFALVA